MNTQRLAPSRGGLAGKLAIHSTRAAQFHARAIQRHVERIAEVECTDVSSQAELGAFARACAACRERISVAIPS